MTARVAVVVRTKNRPVLLERALADIFAQTFGDISAVVVNDGGDTAAVDALVARYADLPGGKLLVLHHEQSLGMEAATNAGIRATESEYIVVHDDDDKWHADFLQRTVEFLDGHPEISGVTTRTDIVFEEINGSTITEVGSERFNPELTSINLLDMLTINRFVPISFLYRRVVHDQVGHYDEGLGAVGDWEFYLRFLQRFPIHLLDGEALAYWCHRPSAQGDMGNSVIQAWDDHTKFDRQVRESYLRQDIAGVGMGSALYLAELAAKQERSLAELKDLNHQLLGRMDGLMARIDRLEGTFLSRTSVSDLARRPMRLAGKIRSALRKP